MRERGAWIGLLVGGVGILLVIVAASRGGDYFVIVPRLAWIVPLAIVGSVTALAASRLGGGRANALLWLGAVVVGGIAWNFLVYSFKFGSTVFRVLVPVQHPTGLDFRDGLYEPGKLFSNAGSGWPPFTLWLGKAFTVVGFSTGYIIQVCILVGFAAGIAVLCGRLAMSLVAARGELSDDRPIDARQLGLLGGLWLITSYGFMFEVERGQIDLYALFFALLAVWLVLRRPMGSPWWPSLALALAVNLKAYPAVLAVILLWRYRWRAVVPLLVANLALLFAAGPTNVSRFFSTQGGLQSSTGPLWWGNNSALALGHTMYELFAWWPSWLGLALLAVSATLWVVTLVLVMRGGWSDGRAVLAAAACVPVMCTFPSISHDYKLVLLVFPLTVLAVVTATARRSGGALWAVLFMAVAFEFFLLARSSMVIAPSLQGSKLILILGLQVLLLIAGILQRRPRGAEILRAGPADADDAAPAGPHEEARATEASA
jgi:hypothetical protein